MSLFDKVMSGIDTVKSFMNIGSSNFNNENHGGSYSTSTSSTVTTYDPDKIEVAKLENERVDLVKNAQLELMEINARLETVMIEARCKGFEAMQISMLRMLKEVNQLAEERLVLLENGNQEQIKKVEAMYADLVKDMDDNDFLTAKMPQLLEIANKFPEGSDSKKLYMNGIEREMVRSIDFKSEQLRNISARCQTVLDSTNASKERMQIHIDTVITKRIEHIEQVMKTNAQLPHNEAVAQIDMNSSNQLKLENKS